MTIEIKAWLFDTVLDEHIWAIVNNDLPKLKQEVDNLLKQ